MSWIFGIAGNITDSLKKQVATFLPKLHQSFNSKNLLLFSGGISETIHNFAPSDNSSGWIVCGLGISSESNQPKFLKKSDWQKLLSLESPNFRQLNGHFAGVKWDNKRLFLFNDPFGLREIYIIQLSDCFAFSTRIVWLTRLHLDCKIDFKQFGAGWLNINQWSDLSFVAPIKRMGPGGTMQIKSNKLELKKAPWIFEQNQSLSADDLLEKLKKFTLFPLNQNKKLSLGLSGGLDSRILLALLLSQSNKNWSLHTFGDPEHPDSLVPKIIAKHFNIDHTILDMPLPSVNNCIQDLHDFIGHNIIHSPASALLRLRLYRPLYQQNKVVIDGGFGEILRRQFLNRLRLRGRKALLRKDSEQIAQYLTHNRGNFFNLETTQIMQKGIVEQIDYLIKTMPDITDTGIENWLDLLAVRTRLPNWYGSAQACVDGLAMNYMPYAQQELLINLFNIPVELRKNGRMLRKIIRQNQPGLTKFPLVKGSVTYPFNRSTIGALLWTIGKQKLGMYHQDTESKQMIHHLAEFIKDTVHSQSVKSFPHYNYPYLIKMVEKYYSGENQNDAEIDWWVAFEIWRQGIYNY